MAFDYIETAQAAYEVLADMGALVLVSWIETGDDYDVEAGAPSQTPRTVQTYGAIVPYPTHKVGTQADSLIRAGDVNLLLAALLPDGTAALEPQPGANVVDASGARFTVSACEAIRPAGVCVLFDITLRR